MTRGLFVLLLVAAATPAAAQSVARAPGTVYHSCSASYAFDLAGAFGRDAVYAWREGGRREVRTSPWPATLREGISTSAQVDEQGRYANLQIRWDQRGGFGWPHTWRPDIHPIYLSVRYVERDVTDPAGGSIDPAAVEVTLRVVSERRLRETLLFRLWREGQPHDQMSLGGPAYVPYWRRSAEIKVAWPDLTAFQRGGSRLQYVLADPGAFPHLIPGNHSGRGVVAGGLVDLSILPRVLEEMNAARRRLVEDVRPGGPHCARYVQPEPSPEEFIDTMEGPRP